MIHNAAGKDMILYDTDYSNRSEKQNYIFYVRKCIYYNEIRKIS